MASAVPAPNQSWGAENAEKQPKIEPPPPQLGLHERVEPRVSTRGGSQCEGLPRAWHGQGCGHGCHQLLGTRQLQHSFSAGTEEAALGRRRRLPPSPGLRHHLRHRLPRPPAPGQAPERGWRAAAPKGAAAALTAASSQVERLLLMPVKDEGAGAVSQPGSAPSPAEPCSVTGVQHRRYFYPWQLIVPRLRWDCCSGGAACCDSGDKQQQARASWNRSCLRKTLGGYKRIQT